jgi:catechol 1,2-dioxygenase
MQSLPVADLLPITLKRLHTLETTVLATIGDDNPRLAHLMRALVSHAHAFVRQTQPTPDEWAEAVDFLIRVGQACTPERNECLLLSDMLGLTSAVDEVNFPGISGATPSSVEGPFHAASPRRANGDWLANGPERARGNLMVFRGRVTDTADTPLAGAVVDVWHADGDGHYDSQDRRHPAGNLRGLFTTDARGEYWFRSVVPSSYPVPTDGPVGGLLREMGRHPMRPAHIHLRVSAAGHRPVTTHAFLAGDEYLQSDAAFAVKDELIVSATRIDDASVAAKWDVTPPFYDIEFAIHLVNASDA